MLNAIIRFFLENKLFTVLVLLIFVGWGLLTAPFDWDFLRALPRDPVPVDAIPDIGENQQIVFTEWEGRSPQDVEDQITYPLTTYLLGVPGVKTIRSTSMFGFSSIYIIFNEDVDFYWSRARILEKLNALPAGLLPPGVQPALGPDATALGQVFWYTLEGRDEQGHPTGGWDLHELRSVQDYYVRYALNSVEGVSEVASIGGFVKEYQIEVNPDALKLYGIGLQEVVEAVRRSNRDGGARTIEVNRAEYLVRGLGYVKSVKDLEEAVVTVRQGVPIRLKELAWVSIGPAPRRGLLDKEGAEVVGGVVVARYGANPLEVIQKVKEKIREIAPGLPEKKLSDGRVSRLTIVPFYDRSTLIYETLGTLEEALTLEVLISILVVVVMVLNLRASVLISALLPIAVLMCFIAMRYFGIDANIVALSGIAIAIGTMVDLGIVLSESIIQQIEQAPPGQSMRETVYKGAAEVSGAILTAVSTTVVSFLPVFALQAAEGKLFHPLAYTKTFALAASLLVALLILPAFAHWFFGFRLPKAKPWGTWGLLVAAIVAWWGASTWAALTLTLFALRALLDLPLLHKYLPENILRFNRQYGAVLIAVFSVLWLLAEYWMPLGPSRPFWQNMLMVALMAGSVLLLFTLLERYYRPMLAWCLEHKNIYLAIPSTLLLWGLLVWLGFQSLFGWVARGFDAVGWNIRTTALWSTMVHAFPGIGEEFMPSLDEGSFLLMPTNMPHAGVEHNREVLAQVDMLLAGIPEVELVVGKAGRVESALDPAPLSMFENIINYKPEYVVDDKGHRVRFKVDEAGRFVTRSGKAYTNEEALAAGVSPQELIPDDGGLYFRNWRAHIQSPDDIWQEIAARTQIPGLTSAPKLQPIETRLVMLQTGMRAPMGIKVYGPDLKTIEQFGFELEKILKQVPSVKAEAVFADRVIGKPYLQLRIKREEAARFGLEVEDILQFMEVAIGGMPLTTTVEGRERYPVRVRYPRELRDTPEAIAKTLVATPTGAQIPLEQVVEIEYTQGPQAIKSEDTFLVSYVLFDKQEGFSEVEVVEAARRAIEQKIASGELTVPAGVSFKFSGSYENQVRAEKRLSVIVPLVLLVIFLILYLQLREVSMALMVFTGVAVAFSGGFVLIWLWGQPWFADFSLFGQNLRHLFGMHPINLSVAIWVGFIALFGISTDDGVLMSTYLRESLKKNRPDGMQALKEAVIEGGARRIRACAMTTATTVIALLPVLTSTGRGADIMIPMAIPTMGGMLIDISSYFLVPVLVYWRESLKMKRHENKNNA